MLKGIKGIITTFEELVFLIKKYKRAKKILHQNADLLTNGIYRINKNQTQIYKIGYGKYAGIEEKYQYDSIEATNIKRKTISTLINALLSRKSFRIQTDKKFFQGQLLCITTMKSNVKVFDFDKRELISVYGDECFFNHLVDNRNYWNKYFDVPSYVAERGKYNIIKEEILQKNDFDAIEILPLLIDDYVKYFERIDFSKDIIIDSDKLKRFCQLICVDKDVLLSYMKSSEYAECVVHGDLWRSNIICTGEKRYYIDFENVGTRVFYYDILLYIYIDWALGNELLMKQYCKGYLDDYLSKLYSGVNINYDPSNKKVMFITFLFFYYLEFWQGKQCIDNKIIELLSQISQ